MTRREALIALRARIDEELADGHRQRRRGLEHGTDSGYHWHRRHDLPFPEDEGGEDCGCRTAHSIYEKARYVRKNAA